MKLKKLAAALLAVVMAASLTACASKEVKWIANSEGQDIPAGIYLYYMMSAYSEAASKVEDSEGKVLQQQVEGVPADQWILTRTDELFRTHLAVEKQFVEQGLTLDEATTGYVDQQLQAQWTYVKDYYEGNGISYDSFHTAYMNGYKENLLFQAQYGPEGKTPVSDADLLSAFYDGYYKIMFISASMVDAEGNPLPDDQKQQAMDKLNGLKDKASAEGAVFQDVILASEKEQAAASGQGEETVHQHTANSHVNFIPKDTTLYGEDFLTAVGEMATGELRIIESGNMAYLVQRMDITTSPDDMENYRSPLLKQLKGDEFLAAEEGWRDAVTVDYNEQAKKLYQPGKLKMD